MPDQEFIMDIVKSLKLVRAAFTASATACKREEYMAECLAAFPFLSAEERERLGREYSTAFRSHGICLGSVLTLPSQSRLLARAARAAVRGEEAWRPAASPKMEEILREEAVKSGLLPDPREQALRDLDLRIAEVERDLHLTLAGVDEDQFARGEADALEDLLEDLRDLRRDHLN